MGNAGNAVPQLFLGTPLPQMISGQGDGIAFHQVSYGKLILGKIIEIVATRCHILKLKCTHSISAWPQTEKLIALPDP